MRRRRDSEGISEKERRCGGGGGGLRVHHQIAQW